jgi:hypothetical protein
MQPAIFNSLAQQYGATASYHSLQAGIEKRGRGALCIQFDRASFDLGSPCRLMQRRAGTCARIECTCTGREDQQGS